MALPWTRQEERIAMAPQGLDPVEVFESLPEKMQKCFETGTGTANTVHVRRIEDEEVAVKSSW